MATDYTISTVTLAASPQPMLLFAGRPNRRCLIIAPASSGVTFVGVRGGDFSSGIFARVSVGNSIVMPIRDYGPLITGEIWVSNSLGNTTINGAELYDIPNRR